MAKDIRGHIVPAPTDAPKRAAFDDLANSINDFTRVKNDTERDQMVSDLQTAGLPTNGIAIYHETEQAFYVRVASKWEELSRNSPLAANIFLNEEYAIPTGIYSRPGNANTWTFNTASGLSGFPTGIALATEGVGIGFKVTVPGAYVFNAAITFARASGGIRYIRAERNSASLARTASGVVSSSVDSTVNVSTTAVLAYGDGLCLAVYQNTGSGLNIIRDGAQLASTMSIAKVS